MKRLSSVLEVGLLCGVAACCLVFPLSQSYAFTGEVSQEFSVAPKYATGLAWDGRYLWACDWWEAKAYKLDPSDGSVVASIELPCPRPDDIAYADGSLFVCDATQPLVYKLDLATGIVGTSYAGPGSSPSALAWDGTYLWASDRSRNELYMLDPADGTVLMIVPSASSATAIWEPVE
jgi:outer membrane protein assembly factor BamB